MEEHNYGIDALRFIAMFFIVLLHVLGQGGVLENAPRLSGQYCAAWFLETLAFCGVNCFAIISGFVLYGKSFKPQKILHLWFQVVFYTIIITAITCYIKPSILNKDVILNAIFPITRIQYWYITSYFGMFLLTPLLNIIITNAPKSYLKKVFFIALIFASVLPALLSTDPYFLRYGQSTLWLCALYLIGAYIKRYGGLNLPTSKALILFISTCIVTWLSKTFLVYLFSNRSNIEMESNIFITFTSPTMIFATLFLFTYCKKMHINKYLTTIIKLFTPCILGIYIIHVNPLIWENILRGCASKAADYSTPICLLYTVSLATLIFITSLGIDFTRNTLFKSLKIEQLSQAIISKFIKTF